MAKKKNLTDRQKRIRRRRRKSTMSRVVFALEIIILVVLMGGLFVYAKLGNMNYEDLNFENVDVNQSVEENQVMQVLHWLGLTAEKENWMVMSTVIR